MPEPVSSRELALELGLCGEEWDRILELLGRFPSYPELGVFSALWSEHCSYKSSRIHLKALPSSSPRVLQGPGENAGVLDIGEGWAVAFKMESHNHPSFIEPYQGAATGVGGILRDIFTMGARPVANLNALRFGELDAPRMKRLVKGVVAGISGYGNCMGIPMLGGDAAFDSCYNGNILVNVFTLGLVRRDRVFRGAAAGPGNRVMYLGAATGRDGIHGASMASAAFGEGCEDKRPAVQVGDPFTEKRLLEACLELFEQDWVIGIQDMGAAGLASSSFEMAGRAGTGLEIHLDQVPVREKGLMPFELMLSESQERMLLVARPGQESAIQAVLQKWDLEAVPIGVVTDTGRFEGYFHGDKVLDLPILPLSDAAPVYDRPQSEEAWRAMLPEVPLPEDLQPEDVEIWLRRLLACPTVAGKRWIWEQYDGTIRGNTLLGAGAGDAGVLRVEGTRKALAMTVDGNSRFARLDPFLGAAHGVAEACRNLSCVGAEPIGITDCLNYGNPQQPGTMWALAQGVQGIRKACLALGVPVVSGNVSLYNETEGESIFPTPMIAAVGLLEEASRHVGSAFRGEGDLLWVLGSTGKELGGSEYLRLRTGQVAGRCPDLDLALERRLQACLREGITLGFFQSAHDTSEGGLTVAILESAFGGGLGCAVDLEQGEWRLDALLFGESASRVVVTLRPEVRQEVALLCGRHEVPWALLGVVGGVSFRLTVDGHRILDLPVEDLARIHGESLGEALEGAAW